MSMAQKQYATGHRKTATAKVWLSPGNGQIVVNGRAPDEYFRRFGTWPNFYMRMSELRGTFRSKN